MPAPTSSEIYDTYDPAFFKVLARAEDRHFWFVARSRIIGEVVRQLLTGFSPDYRVLEVGCGTGSVLRLLEKMCRPGSVTGMDLFEEGLSFARQRVSCNLVAADLRQPPFAQQFNLVGLFDVLEHLPDDEGVLRDLHRLILPGGFLLLTVPARPELWSYFDVAAHHCRRYRPPELERKLSVAGFELMYLTEFMAALLPFAWLRRRWTLSARADKVSPEAARELAISELKVRPVLNTFFRLLLLPERRWISRRARLPFGTSIVALARRPQARTQP